MWGDLKIEGSDAKSRTPTIVRIEVDLASWKITAVWERLQVPKQMAFALEHLSGDDDLDVFSAAQKIIQRLESDDPPFRFVHGDTVEVWQILNDGEPRLLATAAVTVTSLICGDCTKGGSFLN